MMVVRQRIRVGSSPELDVRLVVPPELLNQDVDVVLIPVADPAGQAAAAAVRDLARDLHVDFTGFRFHRDEIYADHVADSD